MNLTKRPCHVSNAAGINTEKHGQEEVGALDLPIDGIVLNRSELETLMGPDAWNHFYRAGEGDDLPQPRYPKIPSPLKLDNEFAGAEVTLETGLPDELMFSDCKIRGLELTFQAGGMTLLKLKVRARPDPELVAILFECLNIKANIEIADAELVLEQKAKRGKKDQQALALPDPQNSEQKENAED